MTRPLRKARNARESALLGLLLVVTAYTFRAALLDIWTIGQGREEQSHILLAPFIAAWLFWLRRSRLRNLRIAPSLAGVGLIVLGCGLSWLGLERDLQIAWHLAPLVAMIGCVVCLTGPRVLVTFGPAIVALLFMMPVPGAIRQLIALPLQAVAAGTTQTLLELMGVQVTRLGHILMINGEQVAVGEACNGMRMVFALWLIVYAFAFSVPLRPGIRGVLLLMSPMTALVSNIIRLIPTTIFYGYGTVEQAHLFHDVSGWVMLPVALFMLVGVLRMIRWIELPVMSFRLAMR